MTDNVYGKKPCGLSEKWEWDGISPEVCAESVSDDVLLEDLICPVCGGCAEYKASEDMSCIPEGDRAVCERKRILVCIKCGADCDVKPHGKENFKETPEIMKELYGISKIRRVP